MREGIIVDTGPLVALLNGRDRYHTWAREMFDAATPPLATCEAVISEACFLLRGIKGGSQAVFGLLERGVIDIAFRLVPNRASIQALMNRYADVPMSVADACLVRMIEMDQKAAVMTLDGDFRVYRRHGRQVVPVLMPEDSAG